jgi:hypothetical protein
MTKRVTFNVVDEILDDLLAEREGIIINEDGDAKCMEIERQPMDAITIAVYKDFLQSIGFERGGYNG